jgi:CPA1 family monovalent cation:H+ antiporter
MSFFQIAAVLLTLAALFAWLNERFLRLPATIGLLALSLAGSLVVVGLDAAGVVGLHDRVHAWLLEAEFSDALLHGMLGLLLFAGALHVDLGDLRRERAPIAVLALGSTLASTALTGLTSYFIFDFLGAPLPLAYCLIFGALIAPTDPIAVLGILKTVGVPKKLETQIAGESLFNDGVAVVVFLVLLEALGGVPRSPGEVALLFAREALGGAVFGLAAGYLAYRMLRAVDQYQVEVLITLALVVGGYAVAEALHISAPIAAVVAGLLIGNQGRTDAMSTTTIEYIDKFWELMDEILNAVLFVLIGLEVIAIDLSASILLLGSAMIVLTLAVRLGTVGLPVALLGRRGHFSRHSALVLTWGGLRGGISVALALSLPAGPERAVVVGATYAVVAFSILVQGLTLGRLLRRLDLGS